MARLKNGIGESVQKRTVPKWTKCPKKNRPQLDMDQKGGKVDV